MKLSPFAIRKLASCVKDIQSGKLWVELFNSFGFRDVYDSLGLPDIGKLMVSDHLKPNILLRG